MVWLGSIAFGIYLWHWPLLVLYRYWRGLDAVPGLLAGPAIVGGSIVLAYVTKRLLEDPVRVGWQQSGWRKRAVAGGLVVAWVAAVATPVGWSVVQWDKERTLQVYTPPSTEVAACWGFNALLQEPGSCDAVLEPEPMVPDRDTAVRDNRWSYDCVNRYDDRELLTCTFGPDDAETRVALIGNSHAAVMIPDFAELAEQQSWQLTTLVGQNCVWLATDASADCGQRWQEQEALLLGDDPFDVVIALGSAVQGATPNSTPTVEQQMPRLLEAGSEVIVLQDNPRMNLDQQSCLLESRDAVLRGGQCDTTTEVGFNYIDPYWVVGQHHEDVRLVQTEDMFCVGETCPLVIGNVIVYSDRHHVTATYAQTLFPELARRMLKTSDVLAGP